MGRLSRFVDETLFALSPARGVARFEARERRRESERKTERAEKHHELHLARVDARKRRYSSGDHDDDRRGYGGGGGFRSAVNSRSSANWMKTNLSPDSALELDREEMCLRADSAYKNYELGTAHVEGRVVRVVGCGFNVEPDLDHEELGLSEEQATKIRRKLRNNWERLIQRLGRRGEWLYEIQQLMQRYWERRGEWFLLHGDRYDPLSPVTTKVDVIHPDRVSSPPSLSHVTNADEAPWLGDNFCRMGVQLGQGDDEGNAVGYYVRDTHPGDNKRLKDTWTYYPAIYANGLPRLQHHFEKVDEGQHRGYARMQVGLERLKNAEEYDAAELERNWEASCQVGVVSSDMPTDDMMASHGVVETSDGTRVRDFQAGMWHYVGETDKVHFNTPGGAPASFDRYMEYEGRQFAAGAGSAYEMLTGNWKGIPYSGARIIWNQEEAVLDVLQLGHFKAILAIYAHFVTRSIEAGHIEVDAVAYRAEPWLWWACRVIPPSRPSLDPREDRNELVLIESKIKPASDFVERKTGEPADKVYRRIARDQKERVDVHGFPESMPQMGRDDNGDAPTQLGDTNQESSDANDGAEVAA